MADEHYIIDLTLLSRYTSNMRKEFAPQSFSIDTTQWAVLSASFVGCSYYAEIAANGITANDYCDVYFDDKSIEVATQVEIIAGTSNNKIVLYAKNIPTVVLSGVYFIKKGVSI